MKTILKFFYAPMANRRRINIESEDWSKVDESRFTLHRNDGRVYVRRMAGEEFSDHCVMRFVNGGGGIRGMGYVNSSGWVFWQMLKGGLMGMPTLICVETIWFPVSIYCHSLGLGSFNRIIHPAILSVLLKTGSMIKI